MSGEPRDVNTVADDSRVDENTPPRTAELHRPSDAGARYAIGDEIARGGLGCVRAAHDRVLDREVAVKSLLERSVAQEVRFAREARVTARLQHPSIVPVYDIGKLGDGRPFYAMKLVSGRSLDQAINGCTELAQRLALLPAMINVVEAIAYAHHEGVIHRDLKPLNVVLGRFGEAMVIDWGIAREVADVRPASECAETLEHDPGTRLTLDGAVLGTPAYMAPEQAAGSIVDERADIYALGAMLYHLFGGKPPYAAASAQRVVLAVIDHPPAPLAALEPGLSRDLVAIVEKAMARAPADRYASARELAGDLRRFETGQLVEAHRYSAWQRIRRFVRRQTAAVTVAAAASLLLVTGGTLALVGIIDSRDRAEEARELAVVQRRAAEALTSFMLGELGNRLAPVGRLDLLGGVGRRVRDYYDALPERDVGEAARRGEALLLIGDTQLAAGELDAAAQTFADVEAHARAHGHDLDLARAELGQAAVFHKTQRRAESERLLDDVITLCETNDDIDLLWRAVIMHADVAIDALDYPGARPWAEHAVALAQLRAETSDAIDTQIDLARSYASLADLWMCEGDLLRAQPLYRASINVLEGLRASSRADTRVLAGLLDAYLEVGRIDENGSTLQRLDASEARALGEELVARDPTQVQWQRSLRSALELEGHIAGYDHDAPRMLATMRRAHGIAALIVELEPDNVEGRQQAARTHNRIGDALLHSGDAAAALAVYRAANLELEREAEAAPGALAAEVVSSHTDLCLALAALERMPEAEVELARAIEIGERDLDAAGRNVDLLRRLGAAHFIAAQLAEEVGRTEVVRGHATRILELVADEHSDNEYVAELRAQAQIWLQ